MDRGYEKIFWGLIMVTFYLEFGVFRILPAFVGWIIVLSGVMELAKSVGDSSDSTESFKKGKTYTFVLVVLTLTGSLMTLSRGGSLLESAVFIYYPIILTAIQLITIFYILEGTHQVFFEHGFSDEQETTKIKLRNYLLMGTVSAATLVVAVFFNNSLANLIGVLLGIISVIYLLVYFSHLKNYWKTEPILEIEETKSEERKSEASNREDSKSGASNSKSVESEESKSEGAGTEESNNEEGVWEES